jgi:predicted negative regulator of RcsB-dependent stress response
LLTGLTFAGGHWVDAGIVLIAVSMLATVGWLGYRWWRHRGRRAAP